MDPADQLVRASDAPGGRDDATSGSFVDNMRLPVHRWFRFSAGFSAAWVEQVLAHRVTLGGTPTVLDPFAGCGTTLLAAESAGVKASGIEAHPFLARVAQTKLLCRTAVEDFVSHAQLVHRASCTVRSEIDAYPPLIRKCYDDAALRRLDQIRRAWAASDDDGAPSRLTWLALASILRSVSHVGTAPWQYVLPAKRKRTSLDPDRAFAQAVDTMAADMRTRPHHRGPRAALHCGDARTCEAVPASSVDLVITSPPYANNFDYADATRLEMSFFGEVGAWADLHASVRRHLVRSCSQHVPDGSVDAAAMLADPRVAALRPALGNVVDRLAALRAERAGRKTYHLMVLSYFSDMARVWAALRRACRPGARVCFVVGDSAPYGVHVPVHEWLGALAVSAGFRSFRFEKIRDRNTKWKNRKHRVPLCEGRLWVEG